MSKLIVFSTTFFKHSFANNLVWIKFSKQKHMVIFTRELIISNVQNTKNDIVNNLERQVICFKSIIN